MGGENSTCKTVRTNDRREECGRIPMQGQPPEDKVLGLDQLNAPKVGGAGDRIRSTPGCQSTPTQR